MSFEVEQVINVVCATCGGSERLAASDDDLDVILKFAREKRVETGWTCIGESEDVESVHVCRRCVVRITADAPVDLIGSSMATLRLAIAEVAYLDAHGWKIFPPNHLGDPPMFRGLKTGDILLTQAEAMRVVRVRKD